MTIEITLEVDTVSDFLIIKIADVEKEFIYNYIHNLRNIKNINTLCIFLHNGNELYIKKNKNNYLRITGNGVEIKTENSSVNQNGYINIQKLHKEMANILHDNNYVSFKIYFTASPYVFENYKIKKSSITEDDLKKQIEIMQKKSLKNKRVEEIKKSEKVIEQVIDEAKVVKPVEANEEDFKKKLSELPLMKSIDSDISEKIADQPGEEFTQSQLESIKKNWDIDIPEEHKKTDDTDKKSDISSSMLQDYF